MALLAGEGDTAVLLLQGGAGYHSLLLRRKMSAVSPSPGRLSPGRKTPPGVSAPSAGLRPLSVSRVKCGGRTLSQPLSEVPYELSTDAHSKKCKRSPQQFIPAGFPLPRQPTQGAGRLRQTPPPHRTRSVPGASPQPQLNPYLQTARKEVY